MMELVHKPRPEVDEGQQTTNGKGTLQKSGVSVAGSLRRTKRRGTSEIATFFNFTKACIGSGIFPLPWGILQAGVVAGGFGMILLGIASVYTMQLLLECKHFVAAKIHPPEKRQSVNYTELGRHALGAPGRWAVNISVLACQLGVSAAYMIFIVVNLHWAANCLGDKLAHHSHSNKSVDLFSSGNSSTTTVDGVCFSLWDVYAAVVPLLIILSFLPSFKVLAYSSYVGTIFLVLALGVIFVFGFIQDHVFCAVHNNEIKYLPSKASDIGLWFGVTAYLFCTHCVVIPLESVMKYPTRMQYVLDATCLVVLVISVPFAIYGYLLFGSGTKGYIFENLPGGGSLGIFYDLMRVFFSIQLILTYPIVFKPATELVEKIWYNILMVLSKNKYGKLSFVKNLYYNNSLRFRATRYAMLCVIRTLLVLASWGIAVGIPRFEICLALVGSLATTIVAFILPPLFHLALKRHKTPLWRNVFHGCFLVAGIAASVLGTGVNLYTAITDHSQQDTCHSIAARCRLGDGPTSHCSS